MTKIGTAFVSTQSDQRVAVKMAQSACDGRVVADPSLFDSQDPAEWERVYQQTIYYKYKKGTRGYSKKIATTTRVTDRAAPIYLIPRQRAGPSYKSTQLIGANSTDVHYAAISKGFGGQDVSSFTLGPIIGEGLCLVNAAFSKVICWHHIEGGGKVDLKRKNFWRRARTPIHTIAASPDPAKINIDGVEYDTVAWLTDHSSEWLPEWELWRKSVALCSRGDFHWTDETPDLAYRHQGRYLSFVEWKKECYIRPSCALLPQVPVFQFLRSLHDQGVVLGLVHPKAIRGTPERPITEEALRDLFDSPTAMCCMPFVVASQLLGMRV